jgi:hypothetical protein
MSQLINSGPTNEKPFKVLAVDATFERANSIRLQGAPAVLRIVRGEKEFLHAMGEGGWDMVLTSLSLQNLTHEQVLFHLEAFWKLGKFRGIIINTIVDSWAKDAVKRLSRKGIPTRWYPYNYNTPSMHIFKRVNIANGN